MIYQRHFCWGTQVRAVQAQTFLVVSLDKWEYEDYSGLDTPWLFPGLLRREQPFSSPLQVRAAETDRSTETACCSPLTVLTGGAP